MGKHDPDNQPRAGRKGQGRKIGKAEVRVQRESGSWIWKQIASLWGDNKKK